MKGNEKVIESLNELLTAELTAINQYYIHAKMCENWGFVKLACWFRKVSIDDMKWADKLIERVLFLEGVPNMQRYNSVLVGETVTEQIELTLSADVHMRGLMNTLIAESSDIGDNGTREQVEGLLVKTEEYIDWSEAQLGIIGEIGLDRYLAETLDAD